MQSNIIGYQKITFLDYPGHSAGIIFFQGCNLSCPYCHNKEISGKDRPLFSMNTTDIINDIVRSYKKGWIQGIVLTGGEPCVNERQLLYFIDQIRQTKALEGLLIKLDTNGTKPDTLLKAIDMVDYVAMDIKKPFNDNYEISLSAKMIIEKAHIYEFRTTTYPPWINKKTIREIGKGIKGARRYFIQQYRETEETESIKPYPESMLYEFKTIISSYVDFCGIRGLISDRLPI